MESGDEQRAGANEAGPDEDVRRPAAFCDGVFAITMTLLVLDLRKPDPAEVHNSADLRRALTQWSAYGAFVLSLG